MKYSLSFLPEAENDTGNGYLQDEQKTRGLAEEFPIPRICENRF
ncbi:MAG: hypothetical protein R3B66_04420 [Candidatus Scalinduaceae bacterium]